MFRSALVCSSALLLLSALTTPTNAEPRPMLAVLDFVSAGADVTETELSLLTDVSRAEARRALGSAYTIITQESIQQLLKAHGKTLEQCQGECETETGKLLGAELVVSGRVMKAFGKLKVNLKLHRTDPPELLDARVLTVDTLPELESGVKEATSGVLSALTGSSAASSDSTDSSTEESGSLRKSIKRAAKGVAKKALKKVVERSKGERADEQGESEEAEGSEEQDRDWRGDTEWFGLYGAVGSITEGSGYSMTGAGIVVEFLKFRFPIMDRGYGFLGLGGARLEATDAGAFASDNSVSWVTLSGALMLGYGYALGGPHGLEISLGYAGGSKVRTTLNLEPSESDVQGAQTMLAYHYRLDSWALRAGVLNQALNLEDDESDTLQKTVFFLGAAY